MFIPGAHAAYISLERFEANQARLAANAASRGDDRRAGPPREGLALLQGLGVCGRCGRRMTVGYNPRCDRSLARYCRRQQEGIASGTQPCQTVCGSGVDDAVAALALEELSPLGIEAALAVSAELADRAAEADRIRATTVERARHAAEAARRRYLAVDPTNRLVASTLEADWNQRLRELTDAQDDYERAAEKGAGSPDEATQARIRVRSWPPTFPRCGLTRPRPCGSASASSASWSPTSPCSPATTTSPPTYACPAEPSQPQRHTAQAAAGMGGPDHPGGHRGAGPRATGRPPLRRGGEHPQRAGRHRRVGQAVQRPVTDCAVQESGHPRPALRDRLRAAGMLTVEEIAAELDVTIATINTWRRREQLTARRLNGRRECLYDPGQTRAARPKGAAHVGGPLPTLSPLSDNEVDHPAELVPAGTSTGGAV